MGCHKTSSLGLALNKMWRLGQTSFEPRFLARSMDLNVKRWDVHSTKVRRYPHLLG